MTFMRGDLECEGVAMGSGMRKHRVLTSALVVQILAIFVIGSFVGVGLYTFIYAKGYSYLGNDPKACVNCHVMEPQYNAWLAGSHSAVATCNDCHVPHDNIVHKYLVKAEHGVNHGFKFTTGWFPDNIQIRDASRKVTNDACLTCHGDFTSDIHGTYGETQIQCTHCHATVGHKTR
ncbi:cytochrome c nitrite reductase small subunit [Corynebacterium ulcerans]|nr:cytochrome c nitrite reductase small subunit [Corynebacterium ulcerans]GJJ41643.1 cytochrome c nitrite reductase small subunit [Corynebacterium ulcerans]